MKICQKCGINHSKSGIYCSRTCANSRTHSEDTRIKIKNSLKGKTTTRSPDPESRKKWLEKLKATRLKKYLETPFDELGMENRRRRVFEEQEYKCNRCGIDKWLDQPISLELEHKDGNNQNNLRNNLEGLCPNCHSITDTWRGRNKPNKNGLIEVTDEFLLQCLNETDNIRQGLLKAGIAAKGNNYARAKKLLGP
jgi:5-methylcytosine-specific restriction endonuclease McrA